MYKRIILYFLCFFFLFSCIKKKSVTNNGSNKIVFFGITGKIPQGWFFKMSKNSIDSEFGYFLSDKQDTIIIDKSPYSNSLTEGDIKILPFSVKNQVKQEYLSDKNIVFVADSIFSQGIDIDEYRKQNIEFCSIDGFYCKLITPRKTSNGITGCYFKDIGDKLKLSIYGENLGPEEQIELIEFIKTFNFHPL